MVARTSFSDKITCIFYFSGLLDLTMNDDDDRTIIQTNEDRRILEKRILEELADKTPKVEMPEREREETLSRKTHRIT